MFKPLQLVEVAGTPEEGFPSSWVIGTIVESKGPEGAKVRYLEFLDEDTGDQLIEDVPLERLRPALPPSVRFAQWDELQVGMAVEMHQDDVWWKGLALRTTPAGMHVYLPDVDHSTVFVKLLKKLRPAYDWVPAPAAAQNSTQQQPQGAEQQQQQQQQDGVQQQDEQEQPQGHWQARALSDATLKELKLTRPEKEASKRLPAQLPHEPMFSELTAALAKAKAASSSGAGAAIAGAPSGSEAGSPLDAAATATGSDQLGQAAAAAEQQQLVKQPGGLKRTDSETASVAEDAAAAEDTSRQRQQQQLAPLQLQGDTMDVDSGAAAAGAAAAEQPDHDDSQQQQQDEEDMEHEDWEMQQQEELDEDDYAEQQQRSSARKQRRLSRSASANSSQLDAGPSRRSGRQAAAAEAAAEAAAAAAATAAAVAAASRTPPRRSGREARRRVVYVDGLPVLRDNLYFEEGEPSVWEKELAEKPYTEQGYPTSMPLSPGAAHRQQQLEHLRQARKQKQAEREARCLSSKPPKGPSAAGQGLAARRNHNAGVRATTQAVAAVRAAYLASHLTKLRPFIAPGVAEAIERTAASAPAGAMQLPEPPSSPPEQLKAVLRDYQVEGVAWLLAQHQRGLNSILADEMGLGKTLQSIAFLATLKWGLGVPGPHLVVVPLSVMSSWMAELARWCPELRAVRLHTSDPEERKRLKKHVLSNPNSFDVAVTTYEMVNSADFGRPIQTSIMWRYLVLDEGHRVRNEDTLTVKALRGVRRGNVLLLTGTPLQNNMVELYGLLSFMYPDVFTTPGPFEAAFNLVKGQVDAGALSDAHYLLRPFCLRRIKDEVEVALPPKVETRIAVPLSDQQTFWYRRLLLRNHEALSALEASVTNSSTGAKQIVGEGNAWRRLLNLIMQLRKVVNHPFMLPDSEPRGEGTSSLQELLEASGKLSVLDRLLSKLKARGHRVVLFSQFTMMLDILGDYLEQAGYEYTRLDGSTNRVQRMINISQFQKPNSKLTVFLSSTRSGGLGLNLQSADTVILYDSDWNPQMDMQAMARVHRIGQTKPVHVYRLITSSSVEERMLQRADAKLYLDQMVNRGSTARAQQLDSLNTSELLSMLSFGADRILANQAGEPPSDADLERILDRSQDAAQKAAAALAAEKAAADKAAEKAAAEAEADGDAAAEAAGSAAAAVKQEAASVKEEEQGGEAAATASDSSIPDGAAAEAAGGAVLMDCHLTAANFQPDAPPPNTFQLNGVDYSRDALEKLRQQAAADAAAAGGPRDMPLAQRKLLPSYSSKQAPEEGVKAQLRDIASEYWAAKERQRLEEAEAGGGSHKPERDRQQRTITVDGYEVLKVNNYNAQAGGISAWEETGGPKPKEAPKRKLQKAGRDYAHQDMCQVCWDGGDLICCDVCPAAYHAECLGQDIAHLTSRNHWACPHHSCATCGRGPQASGGLLFRCGVCECAWCEDHLPAEHEILGEWPMYQALGQDHPSNACFVMCGPDCQELQWRLSPTITATIEAYTADPELRFREALQDEAGNLKAKKKARKTTSRK